MDAHRQRHAIVFPAASTVIALALAIAPISAVAAPRPAMWIALSTTAIAITGNLAISARSITFGDRATLPLAFVGTVAKFKEDIGESEARIYRVTTRANPKLLNGNTLCGAPIMWIALYSIPTDDLGMAVFSGPHKPTSESSTGLCATFSYARQTMK